jgi:hypothetical protein
MCCWRRLAINWTDRVKNEEILQIVKEERDMQHTVKMKASQLNWSHLAYELPSETYY